MDKKLDERLYFPRNKKKIKGSKHSSTKQEKYFMYERETSVGSSCIAAEKERVRAEERGRDIIRGSLTTLYSRAEKASQASP